MDWIASDGSYPGEPRFRGIRTLVKLIDRTELPTAASLIPASRSARHRATSNASLAPVAAIGASKESLHWLLDVTFKDDLSRYRTGNGAKNMAVVRRFALNLVRANKTEGSVKLRRKTASWRQEFLLQVLQQNPR